MRGRLAARAAAAAAAAALAAGTPAQEPGGGPEPRPYVETVRDGYVDWGEGTVAAWGRALSIEGAHAVPEGEQVQLAAELDGRRNLLAIVQNLRANAEFRIGDRPDVVERVQGIVRGAKVLKRRQGKGRFYEVLVSAPLHGVEGISYSIHEATSAAPAGGSGAGAPEGAASSGAAEGATTGIVIDARGTGLQPALLPRIVDESGAVVASPATVNQADLRERGMAAYATLPAGASAWRGRVGGSPLWVRAVPASLVLEGGGPAASSPPARIPPRGTKVPPPEPLPEPPGRDRFPERRGPRPYRLQASGAAGALKADIVLSKADADRIAADPEAAARLKECRVLVIVESPVGGVEGVERRRLEGGDRSSWPEGA
jgi:hypothetical protein